MGYLSSLFRKVSGPDEVQEAMVDTICLAATGGRLTRSGREVACSYVAEALVLPEDEAVDLVESSFERIEEEGVEGVIEQIVEDVVQEEDRAAIFQVAVFVQAADRHHDDDPGEEELLAMLAASLDLTVDEIEELTAEATSGFQAYAADETFEPAPDDEAFLEEEDDLFTPGGGEDEEGGDDLFSGEDDGLVSEEF